MDTKERSIAVPQGLTTGLWSQLARDVKRSVAGLVDRRQVVDIDDAGLVRVTSPDPSDPVAHAVARLRNLRMQAGDDVLTLRLGGGELIVGVIPKPGQADDPLPASALDVDALKSGNIVRVLSADLTTTIVTAATIPALSFPIGANETWTADYVCRVGCSASGGIKWRVSRPSGYSLFQCLMQGNGPSLQSIESQIANGVGLGATAFCTVVTTVGWMRISVMVANGATAGTVSLGFASTTAAQTSTVYAGSFLTARRIS